MFMNCPNCKYYEPKQVKCLLKNKMMGDRCCPRKCEKFELKKKDIKED